MAIQAVRSWKGKGFEIFLPNKMTVRNEGILDSLRNIHWDWARNETKISPMSFLFQAKREMEAKGSEEKRQKISIQNATAEQNRSCYTSFRFEAIFLCESGAPTYRIII